MKYSDKQNIDTFQSLVRTDLDSLEGSLQTALSSRVPLIREICRYIEDTPGKRLRPTCLFLAGRSSGNGHVDMIPAGLAVELIHTATLLHDDIVDRHSTRRGKPTVHDPFPPPALQHGSRSDKGIGAIRIAGALPLVDSSL